MLPCVSCINSTFFLVILDFPLFFQDFFFILRSTGKNRKEASLFLRIPQAHNSSAQVIPKKSSSNDFDYAAKLSCKAKSKKGFASTCRTMISFPDLSSLVIVVPLLRSNWSQIINVSSFLLTYMQLSMSGKTGAFLHRNVNSCV